MGDPFNKSGKSGSASGFQISVQPLLEGDEPEHPGKFASGTTSSPGDAGESGELPRSYGENWIYLTAQDPHRLFTYWDLDIASHPGGPAIIRCYLADTQQMELEFEVPFEARNWYIPVSKAGTAYRVEIGHYRSGDWVALGSSEATTTPSDHVSDDTSFRFATLPLDTAFSALLASLPPQVRHHPDLMRHLASIQQRQGVATRSHPGAGSNEEALRLLKEILGDSLLLELLSGSWDSAALSSAIQARLTEVLSSEASSEMLTRFQELASASSLFSGLVTFENLSSESLSSAELSSGALSSLSSWTESLVSWSHAARHAAASEWLSSWGMVPAGGESSAGAASASWFGLFASSWGAAAAAASGETGSWSAGAGAFPANLSSEQLASWSGGPLSSWSLESMSSWSQEVMSSWSEAALSSWFGEAMSSWTAESLSSWTQELLTSWSAAETGSWSGAPTGRGFFMHVNAELIFYGGTDPQAQVTVNGEPITLSPDGTFHYHFVFPDGAYEIPIVAVSPDGVERRQAILRFERQTATEGQVDATGQPLIAAPMGRKS